MSELKTAEAETLHVYTLQVPLDDESAVLWRRYPSGHAESFLKGFAAAGLQLELVHVSVHTALRLQLGGAWVVKEEADITVRLKQAEIQLLSNEQAFVAFSNRIIGKAGALVDVEDFGFRSHSWSDGFARKVEQFTPIGSTLLRPDRVMLPPVVYVFRRPSSPWLSLFCKVLRVDTLDPLQGITRVESLVNLISQGDSLTISPALMQALCPMHGETQDHVVTAYHIWPANWVYDNAPPNPEYDLSALPRFLFVPTREPRASAALLYVVVQDGVPMTEYGTISPCHTRRRDLLGEYAAEPLVLIPVARKVLTKEGA